MFFANWLVGSFLLIVLSWFDLFEKQNIPNEMLQSAMLTGLIVNLLTFGLGPVFFLCLVIGAMLWILFKGLSEVNLIGDAEPDLVLALWLCCPLIWARLPLILWVVAIGALVALSAGMVLWATPKTKPTLKSFRAAYVPFIPFIGLFWLILGFWSGLV